MMRRKKLEALVGGGDLTGTSSVLGVKLARKDSMHFGGDQTPD